MNTLGRVVFIVVAVAIVTMLFTIGEELWRHWRFRGQDQIDWGLRMQEAAQAHFAAVNDAYYRQEEGETDVVNPAFGPYCGCETCVVREVLAGAFPVIVELAAQIRKYGTELHLQGGHDE